MKGSYEFSKPCRPLRTYPSSQPSTVCSDRISMTLPSGAKWPPSASSGKYSPIHTFCPASYTLASLLDSVSSGPKRRKFFRFWAMTSRRYVDMLVIEGAYITAGWSTSIAYFLKSGSLSGFLSWPPFATGFADMRLLPSGQTAIRSSSLILPSLPNSRSGS